MSLNLNIQYPIQIQAGGEYLCTPAWSKKNLIVDQLYWRCYLPVKGEAFVLNAGDKREMLKPGFFYCIPAFVPHAFICPKSMQVYWMHLTFSMEYQSIYFSNCKENLIHDEAFLGEMKDLFIEACKLLGKDPGHPKLELLQEKWNLLLAVHSVFTKAFSLVNFPKEKCSESDWLMKVSGYIREQVNNNLDLGFIARKLSWSEAHLRKVFREHTGETPFQFHEKIRILKAQKELKETAKSISEIAYEIGWEDPLYFSKVFKTKVGQSPRAYRKDSFVM